MKKNNIVIIVLIVLLVAAGIIAGVHFLPGLIAEDPELDFEEVFEYEDDEEDGDIDESDIDEEEDDEDRPVLTLEQAMYIFEDDYKKTPDGYRAKVEVDGVKSDVLITAKGNNVILTASYDYGDNNEEMIKFYKEDPNSAVERMLSTFITSLADEANTSEGQMEYIVSVGGSQVTAGVMTLKQAREYEAMGTEFE